MNSCGRERSWSAAGCRLSTAAFEVRRWTCLRSRACSLMQRSISAGRPPRQLSFACQVHVNKEAGTVRCAEIHHVISLQAASASGAASNARRGSVQIVFACSNLSWRPAMSAHQAGRTELFHRGFRSGRLACAVFSLALGYHENLLAPTSSSRNKEVAFCMSQAKKNDGPGVCHCCEKLVC